MNRANAWLKTTLVALTVLAIVLHGRAERLARRLRDCGYRLRLWWIGMTIALLEDQYARVREDLNAIYKDRADLMMAMMRRGQS